MQKNKYDGVITNNHNYMQIRAFATCLLIA